MSNKARNSGFRAGVLPPGRLNNICDVGGVRIAHRTLNDGGRQTGVTAVIPAAGNLYLSKLQAGCHVINGYGKSCGLIQLSELGCIETPIVLTNTFAAGTAFTAVCRRMLEQNPAIGIEPSSVNPVVMECNDGYLNEIRAMHITEDLVSEALLEAESLYSEPRKDDAETFAEGAVGAGRGMSCHGLKGGIGSSSRIIALSDAAYTLGVLVLTNHGKLSELKLGGYRPGSELAAAAGEDSGFKGSVIVITATDAPLSQLQLCRLSRRAQNGLAAAGSVTASGSGEISVAYSTRNRLPHYGGQMLRHSFLHDDQLDVFFTAVSEAVEEAVISSLFEAESVEGRDGNSRLSLLEAASRSGLKSAGEIKLC